MSDAINAADWNRFELERHVERALRTAWALAGNDPINAGHLIRGALLEGRDSKSSAFRELQRILAIDVDESSPPDRIENEPLSAMRFNGLVADSLRLATTFLDEADGDVWGRDYITIALLTTEDPSLSKLVQETSQKLDEVQARWYKFVISDDRRHRDRETWGRWWQATGTPIQKVDEELTKAGLEAVGSFEGTTHRESKGGSFKDDAEDGGKTSPKAFLLTWNPELFSFEKFTSESNRVSEGVETLMRWSTGRRRNDMSVGDRVFLLRHGADQPGMVGSGRIAGEVIEDRHWHEQRAANGDLANFVMVNWDVLQEFPLITRKELGEITHE